MLIELLTRGNIENPSVPITAHNIADTLGIRNASSAGVNITSKTTLGNPAIWKGTALIARTLASLPAHVFDVSSDGSKTRDAGSRTDWLLNHTANNDFLGFRQVVQTTTVKAIIKGDGYAWILRDRTGQPEQLVPLMSDAVVIARKHPKTRMAPTGGLIYLAKVRDEFGKSFNVEIEPDDILHVRGLHLAEDGIHGIGIIDQLKDSIGVGLAQQTYAGSFFANSANPQVVIEVPYKFRSQEEVDAFRSRWSTVHGGIKNQHRPAILENGATVKPLSLSPEDAQLLASREFDIITVANTLGLPPSKLGSRDSQSYNTLEAENRAWLLDSLWPWVCEWQDELRRKLLTFAQRQNKTIAFKVDELKRADRETEHQIDIDDLNNGLRSLNEIRQERNLPRVEGGDDWRVPLNIGIGPTPNTTAVQDGVGGNESAPPDLMPETPARDIVADHAIAMLERETKRIFKRIGTQARRRCVNPLTFREWANTFDAKEAPILADACRHAVIQIEYLTSGSTDHGLDDYVSGVLKALKSDLLNAATRHGADTLKSAIDETMDRYETNGKAAELRQLLTASA